MHAFFPDVEFAVKCYVTGLFCFRCNEIRRRSILTPRRGCHLRTSIWGPVLCQHYFSMCLTLTFLLDQLSFSLHKYFCVTLCHRSNACKVFAAAFCFIEDYLTHQVCQFHHSTYAELRTDSNTVCCCWDKWIDDTKTIWPIEYVSFIVHSKQLQIYANTVCCWDKVGLMTVPQFRRSLFWREMSNVKYSIA